MYFFFYGILNYKNLLLQIQPSGKKKAHGESEVLIRQLTATIG